MIGQAVEGDEDVVVADALRTLGEWIPALVLAALVVLAVRGVVGRVYVARDTPPSHADYPRRWRSLTVYVVGLVVGAAVGLGLALETDGLWTIGLGLGLGASVVGVPLIEQRLARWRVPRRSVPRKPGHDEDV